jgi:dihydrodipicolinate synthase/N-acetylneuraminate lyase
VKIGVIVYNRGACQAQRRLAGPLAERCPNLIGFKDGLGDIERIVSIRQKLGDRFVYIGGMPTHEVYAQAYKALGVPVYSSAVFNFVPRTAIEFYNAYCQRRHRHRQPPAQRLLPALPGSATRARAMRSASSRPAPPSSARPPARCARRCRT